MFQISRAITAAAAMCLGTVNLAQAQDFTQDWEGFYAGVHLDGTVFSNTISDLNNQFNSNSPEISVLDFQGGVTGGYNYMLEGNLLVGAELDYTSSIAIDEFFSSNEAETTGTQYTHDLESILSLRGRAGVVNGNTLSFMTLGVAQGTTNFETFEVDTGSASDECDVSNCASSTDDLLGLTVGFGMEWAFRENISARFDVQHYAFESVQAPVVNAAGDPACSEGETDLCTVGYAPSTTSIRVGISYHF